MPHMMARSWNSPPRPVPLRTSSAREPPICRAAPSRPAEPPKAWVSTVAQNTTGASRRETGCSPRAAWMIRSVPPAVLMPPRRYIHTTTSPATGRRRLVKQAPQDPHQQPHPQTKEQALAVEPQALLAEGHLRIQPPEKGRDRVAPLPGGMVGLCHNCPLPFLSKVSHLSIITQWAGFAMAISPQAPGCQGGRLVVRWGTVGDSLRHAAALWIQVLYELR